MERKRGGGEEKESLETPCDDDDDHHSLSYCIILMYSYFPWLHSNQFLIWIRHSTHNFLLSQLFFFCFVFFFAGRWCRHIPSLFYLSFTFFHCIHCWWSSVFIFPIHSIFFLFIRSWYHHHQGVPTVRILLTLSCHPSLGTITLSKSSRRITGPCTELMIVSCCWSTNTGASMCSSAKENVDYRFIFTSLSSAKHIFFVFFMVFEMGVKWPYSCCFVVRCFLDVFKQPYIVPI